MTHRSRAGRFLAGLLTAVVLLVGAGATPAGAAPAGATPADPQLQRLLDALVAKGATGALAVVDDGSHTWRLASGVARLDPRRPLRPDARFRVASVTKTFVATVALQLVGEGRLRLDDTVERWVPGLVPNGTAITLRMLLNHSSGLYDYTDDPSFWRGVTRNPTSPMAPRQLVAVATAHPPRFAPGTRWSYSNTGYIVAGMMIEAATGDRVEHLVRERITRPLRLRHTTFPTHPRIAGYHADGYVPPSQTGGQGYQDVTRFSPSLAWTAGAIISTADDLRRFYAALLGGRLLRPRLLAEMERTVRISAGAGYGLGLVAEAGRCGRTWGHTGGIPGYATYAFSDRSGRRGAVVMMPTSPDKELAPLFATTVTTAMCQALGRAAPEAPALGRAAPEAPAARAA